MFVLAALSFVGENLEGFGVKDAQIVNFNCSHTQKALPCIKTRRLSHQPSKSFFVIIHVCVGTLLANRLQPNFADLYSWPAADAINRAKFHFDRSRGFACGKSQN